MSENRLTTQAETDAAIARQDELLHIEGDVDVEITGIYSPDITVHETARPVIEVRDIARPMIAVRDSAAPVIRRLGEEADNAGAR